MRLLTKMILMLMTMLFEIYRYRYLRFILSGKYRGSCFAFTLLVVKWNKGAEENRLFAS